MIEIWNDLSTYEKWKIHKPSREIYLEFSVYLENKFNGILNIDEFLKYKKIQKY